VKIDGRVVVRDEVSKRARRGLAYIPERGKIFAELTVSENLEIFAQRRRQRQGFEEDKAFAFDVFPALERLPAKRAAGLLSGGEQQMLAIAGALICAPDVLMVDEPSLGLAPILVLEVMRALGRVVAERDLALLLVDQNIRSTQHLASRIYTMHAGELELQTGDDIHERLIRTGYARAAL
jgi:branched-chain amino acid transport system ATP-binding protein